MTPRLGLIAAAAAAWVGAGAAGAQPAPAGCAQMDASLPIELAGWTQRAGIVAAANPADLATAELAPGQAVTATLHPTRQVAYLVQPEKPGGSVAHGGLFRVRIGAAGTYRFVLGSGAWIDVLQGRQPVASTAHSPGPACSTARKMVEFPLQAGDYVLQVSANADPTLAILVIRRP